MIDIDRPFSKIHNFELRASDEQTLASIPLLLSLTMEAYATTTTLILLDIPPQTSFTLDTYAFTSTPQFRGIKFLEPGIHLLTYGLDKSELGMRNGVFFQANPGDVLAWKWDQFTEQLKRIEEQIQGKELTESISHHSTLMDIEGQGLMEGLQSLHPYLTTVLPPSEDDKTTWKDLTSFITIDLLNRVLPGDWSFTSQTPSTNDDSTDTLSSLPSSKTESQLHFTPLNLKRTFNPTALGRERTEQILDKSWYLNTLLMALPEEVALLGELQLSFLAVLYMNNFSGFETWKKLFTVFCGCKAALRGRERLFRGFLGVVRQQFEVCSEETFNEVILEGGNFVAENLKTLKASIEELQPKSSALEFSFAQLTASLNSKFNWDPMDSTMTTRKGEKRTLGFDENAWDREEDDYAPVVVDLDSEDDDEEAMDADVDFGGRVSSGGHMDMKTGKMVFGS